MKKFIIAATLAVLAASPAMAASQGHHARNAAATTATNANDTYGNDSFAYAAPRADYVVNDGRVVGADPDVFIRESLVRQVNPADLAQ